MKVIPKIFLVVFFITPLLTVAGKMKPDDAVRNFFGKTITIEKKFKRFVFHGDVNGDNKTDYVYVVRTQGKVAQLPNAVEARALSSFQRLSSTVSLKMKDPKAVSLAVILSAKKPRAMLLVDTIKANPFYQAWHDGLHWLPAARAGKIIKGYKLKAVGDLLIIPTPAGIDTYLYWDGKKFVHYWPEEMP